MTTPTKNPTPEEIREPIRVWLKTANITNENLEGLAYIADLLALSERQSREYYELETRCDPGGEVAALFAAKENQAGLELKLKRQSRIDAAKDRKIELLDRAIRNLFETNNDKEEKQAHIDLEHAIMFDPVAELEQENEGET